jgi:hypothetical protein
VDLLDDDRCAFARFCHRETATCGNLRKSRAIRIIRRKPSGPPATARRGG